MCGFSHTGNHRTENQDAFVHCSNVVVVADGMGGHPNGRAAATFVCEKIIQLWDGREAKQNLTRELLESWFFETNNELIEKLPDSGTTCAVLAFYHENFLVSWVGDSRVYMARDGHVAQLTTDDNLATTSGTGLNAHILTNHMGKKKLSNPGHIAGKVLRGDQFVLVTDGAYSGNERNIFDVMKHGATSENLISNLKSIIVQSDPKDNYTLVIARPKE